MSDHYFDSSATGAVELLRSGRSLLSFFELTNPNTSDVYLQLFDAAAVSSVTLGSTTPDLSFHCPAGTSTTVRAIRAESFDDPVEFLNGICYAVTTTSTNATSPGTAATVNILARA